LSNDIADVFFVVYIALLLPYEANKNILIAPALVSGTNNHLSKSSGGRCFADCAGVDLLASSQHVNDRILDESAEHKHQTGGHPDVDRLGERDRRKSALARALRRDGEHREDAERDASRHRLEVDPERHPRQQHHQHARQVRRQDVGA